MADREIHSNLSFMCVPKKHLYRDLRKRGQLRLYKRKFQPENDLQRKEYFIVLQVKISNLREKL